MAEDFGNGAAGFKEMPCSPLYFSLQRSAQAPEQGGGYGDRRLSGRGLKTGMQERSKGCNWGRTGMQL